MPAGALHERLDDDRADIVRVALEDRAQLAEPSPCALRRAFAGHRFVGIGRRREDRLEQQWRVSAPVQRNIGDRQRAERLAVIAAGQRDEARAPAAAVLPVVEAELERDFDRARAVVGIEHAAQRTRGVGRFRRDAHQRLGKLDRRLVREAGQHHVVEPVELRLQCRDDARVAVAEQARPPRADRVEIAPSVVAVQPGAFGAGDRHHRQRFVVVHLRARMPDDGEVARRERGGFRGDHGLL